MRASGYGRQYTSKELAAVMRGVELLRAVEAGNPAAVRALLAQDAALNISISSGGDTALLRALKNKDKNPEIVKMLLDKGADVNVRDIEGTPLLIWAQNNAPTVEMLLDKGADINAKTRAGETMLIFAAKWGWTEVVRLLVKRGADLSLKNNFGETALYIAERSGTLEVIDRKEIAKILRDTAEQRKRLDSAAINQAYDDILRKLDPVTHQIEDLLATGDPLAGIVHAGNVEKAREFFNGLFWADKNRKPQWDHLQLALLTENKPMLRLLITWGASCTPENMGELKHVTAEKYPHYAALLRSSGLRVPEAVSAPVPSRPKVGDKMPDGTIYAGFSPDTQRPIYVSAEDASLTMTFNQAREYASKLEARGHSDWRMPTKEELNVLYQNKDKGFLKGTFNETRGECWYWSSTKAPDGQKFACNQRFDYGRQSSYFKSQSFNIRCVRG